MYAAYIMYKKGRMAFVLLCESLQSMVALNDSDCEGASTLCCRLDSWQRINFPLFVLHFHLTQAETWVIERGV